MGGDGDGTPARPEQAADRKRRARWREPPALPVLARLEAYPWFIVGTVCIGAFMGQLDASIAQLVLPELEPEFHASVGAVAWVSVAYLLVVAATLPVFGRLADILGRKLLYSAGFLIFIIGSAGCGLAPSLAFLIAARIVQGLGAGLLQANSVAIVVGAAGPARRGRALGLQAASQAVGLSAGPTLGGLLIDTLGWRWVFWINVPAGLLGALLGFLVLPRSEVSRCPGRFDLLGALLLVPALALLLLAIKEGARGGLGPVPPALLLVATAILFAAFVWRERRAPAPLLDLALLRDKGFVASNAGSLVCYMILFGAFFILPFVFERAYRDTALIAGLRLSAIPAALGLMAPAAGALYDRLGARPLKLSGMAAVFAGVSTLAVVLDGEPALLPAATAALALFGVGLGLFTAPNNAGIMGAARAGTTGQAGGILNMMRALGMSLGISLAAVILGRGLGISGAYPHPTSAVSVLELLRAGTTTFTVLAVLAVVAALLSLVRANRRQPTPRPCRPG